MLERGVRMLKHHVGVFESTLSVLIERVRLLGD